MLTDLFARLEAIHPMSESLRNRLTRDLEPVEVKKRDVLLREGERADYLYVVLKGMLRSFYLRNGIEITSRFMREYHIVVSVNSFYKRAPGYEFIEAMEDTIVARIHYDTLQK